MIVPILELRVTKHAVERFGERKGETATADTIASMVRQNWGKARDAQDKNGYEVPLVGNLFASVRPDKKPGCWKVTTVIADSMTELICERLGLSKKVAEKIDSEVAATKEPNEVGDITQLSPLSLENEMQRLQRELVRRRSLPEYLKIELTIWPKGDGKTYFLGWTYNGKPTVEVEVSRRELKAIKTLIAMDV